MTPTQQEQESARSTLPEIGSRFLSEPALVKQGDEYHDDPASCFAFTAHGFDTDLTPFYSAAQLKAAMIAADQAATERAARIADGYAKRNFPWASENSDTYHAQADWAQLIAAAIRGTEGRG